MVPPPLSHHKIQIAMKSSNQVLLKALIIASIFFQFNALYAQQNAIRITPLQPVIGKFSIDIEHVIDTNTTFMLEFQSWFEHRSSGLGLLMLGIPVGTWDDSYNKGFRMSFLMRQYYKGAMHGGFMEGGAYIGLHYIRTRTETTIFLPDPTFPFPIWQTTVEEKDYGVVRSCGLRLGGGWHKVKGKFSMEFSGGFNLNAVSKEVRPTLGMKAFSPYSRIALGVAF